MTKPNQAPKIIQIIVGIAEYKIATRPEEILVTFALGSCIGITFYDPILKVGALAHCLIPTTNAQNSKRNLDEMAYVDTSIQQVLSKLFDLGSKKRSLICNLAGCSSMFNTEEDHFRVGEKNYAMAKAILDKNNIEIKGESIGGIESRTMLLEMDSGKTFVVFDGKKTEL